MEPKAESEKCCPGRLGSVHSGEHSEGGDLGQRERILQPGRSPGRPLAGSIDEGRLTSGMREYSQSRRVLGTHWTPDAEEHPEFLLQPRGADIVIPTLQALREVGCLARVQAVKWQGLESDIQLQLTYLTSPLEETTPGSEEEAHGGRSSPTARRHVGEQSGDDRPRASATSRSSRRPLY